MGQAVTLDFSKAQPIASEQAVTLDFSKAQPIETPKQGFWSALGSDLKAMVPKFNGPGLGEKPLPERVAAGEQARVQDNADYATADATRKQAGYSTPYRRLAPVAEGLGVNVTGMEQAAAAGDPNAVLGHAAAVPAVMAATEGLARGVPAAGRTVARILPDTKAVVTAPIRLAARTTEAAINQKIAPIRPIVRIMTPADEAGSLHLNVPGRDFGLPKPEIVIQHAEALRQPLDVVIDKAVPPSGTTRFANTRAKTLTDSLLKQGDLPKAQEALDKVTGGTAQIQFPPDAPGPVIELRPKSASKADILETKSIQEQIRDAADAEDRTRLSQNKREWFGNNSISRTKGDMATTARAATTKTTAQPVSGEVLPNETEMLGSRPPLPKPGLKIVGADDPIPTDAMALLNRRTWQATGHEISEDFWHGMTPRKLLDGLGKTGLDEEIIREANGRLYDMGYRRLGDIQITENGAKFPVEGKVASKALTKKSGSAAPPEGTTVPQTAQDQLELLRKMLAEAKKKEAN